MKQLIFSLVVASFFIGLMGQARVEAAAYPNSAQEILTRLSGRWFREANNSEEPDVQTMRLFRAQGSQLTGRFLAAGPYSDVGMAATLSQDGEQFTMTLVDDELREHGYVGTKTLTGRYDVVTHELMLRAADGSQMTWKFDETYFYRTYFTSDFAGIFEQKWDRYDLY